MPFPWLAAGTILGTGLSALGTHKSGKKAEKAARQSAAQARLDYFFNYLPSVEAANVERRQGAGIILSQIMNAARQGKEIPKSWLVEAKTILGPSFEAFEDVVNAEMGAYKKGRLKEVEDKLKKFKGLPGGTELSLKQQAMDEVVDAGIRAQAQGKVEHTKMSQAVNLANAENALRAGTANLDARTRNQMANTAAQASALTAGLGPLASLLNPVIPQQMGDRGYFQGPVAASGLENLGSAITDATMLYSTMGGGGGNPFSASYGSMRPAVNLPMNPVPGTKWRAGGGGGAGAGGFGSIKMRF